MSSTIQQLKDDSLPLTTEHFSRARSVIRPWRRSGYDYVMVIRRSARAERCYPCGRQDIPGDSVAGWDYYPIPSLQKLSEGEACDRPASRAELWVAATIAYGCNYITQS